MNLNESESKSVLLLMGDRFIGQPAIRGGPIEGSYEQIWPLVAPEAGQSVILWNAKTTFRYLLNTGQCLPTEYHDVRAALALLDETWDPDICDAVDWYLDYRPASPYQECQGLSALWAILAEQLVEDDLWELYQAELPLAGVLAGMERRGILVDVQELEAMSRHCQAQQAALEQRISSVTGATINPASPTQLSWLLHEHLGLQAPRPRPSGSIPVDEAALARLSDQHPVVGLVLEHRKLAKLNGTYLTGLRRHLRQGRVHCQIDPFGTVTGRFSIKAPNLQAVPGATKKLFVADPGHALVQVDYAQIELLLLANFSGDPLMLQAFRDGHDLHRATAAKIFGKDEDDVVGLERSRAKSLNFGLVYGMGAQALSAALKVDLRTAAEFMRRHADQFPAVDTYRKQVCSRGYGIDYWETVEPIGRRRRHFFAEDLEDDAAVNRMAFNFNLQGSVASMVRRAMVRLAGVPQIEILLQVHDALLLQVPTADLADLSHVIREAMVSVAPDLAVQPKVALTTGRTWADCAL